MKLFSISSHKQCCIATLGFVGMESVVKSLNRPQCEDRHVEITRREIELRIAR